ncbi:MAG: response regulator [Nannocystaceae bacterium]
MPIQELSAPSTSSPFPRAERAPSRILLVEDDPFDATLMRRAIQLSGVSRDEPLHARSLEEARPHLDGGALTLIILDLRLPDSRGLETIARLRGVDAQTPLVVVSELDDRTLQRAALAMGASAFLSKRELDVSSCARRIAALLRGEAPARDSRAGAAVAARCADLRLRAAKCRAALEAVSELTSSDRVGDEAPPTARALSSGVRRRRRARGRPRATSELRALIVRSMRDLDEINRLARSIHGAVVGAGRTVELVGLNELVRQACERSSPSLPPRTKITTDFTEDAALSPDSAIVRELLAAVVVAAATFLAPSARGGLHISTTVHRDVGAVMIQSNAAPSDGDASAGARAHACAALVRTATRATRLGGGLVWGGHMGRPQWVRVSLPVLSSVPA